MKVEWFLNAVIAVGVFASTVMGGEPLQLKNSRTWQLSGRVQFQHLYNPDIEAGASVTRQGFRMRRGRFQVKARVSDYIQARMQLSVRDSKVRILDLDATLTMFENGYLRIGQFKVPVWREELRSSGKLILVERSKISAFLLDYHLAGRQLGVEVGYKTANGIWFAANLSNGSGMNVREDAGQTKSDFVNNGKLYTARAEMPFGSAVSLGIAAAYNEVGRYVAPQVDNRGSIALLSADVNIKLPLDIEVEGGAIVGTVSRNFLNTTDDEPFRFVDVSGRKRVALAAPVPALAGLQVMEIAGGVTLFTPNPSSGYEKALIIRGGPAVYFGKHTRFQMNVEYEKPDDANQDATIRIRSQFTVNF